MKDVLDYIKITLGTKTGKLGAATILITIVGFATNQIDYQAAIAGLVAGLGMVFGREAIKKTGEKL